MHYLKIKEDNIELTADLKRIQIFVGFFDAFKTLAMLLNFYEFYFFLCPYKGDYNIYLTELFKI